MTAWAWIGIALALAIVVAIVIWVAWRARRTSLLQERFGPEYDRVSETRDGRAEAEAELAARVKRRESLDIRPLPVTVAERYLSDWRDIQARFVERPGQAVVDADRSVTALMQERGYPMDDFEQRANDISVDYPDVVEAYRKAHAVATSPDPDTDELRMAMLRYRELFERLLETSGDAKLSVGRSEPTSG